MLTLLALVSSLTLASSGPNRIANGDFSSAANGRPASFELTKGVHYGSAGYVDEYAGRGVALDSFSAAGEVSQLVHLNAAEGRWVVFRIRGRAEDGFSLTGDDLYLRMDFYAKGGASYEDTAKRLIWRQVKQDRKDFATNGDDGKNGAAVWRSYSFEERLPFAETDAVKVTLGFAGGDGKDAKFSRFYATDFELRQYTASTTGHAEPTATTSGVSTSSGEGLVPLGGRWYYRPTPGESVGKHLIVNLKNADRLFYKDAGYSTPFAGNMDAMLRAGCLDENGQMVTKDRYVPDNLWIEFDGSSYWTIHARNIPNHPTAKFPDTYGSQGYNPNYIQEHNNVFRLPIYPKPLAKPFALPASGVNNGALHMGPIGFAINGVVFFNPYDANSSDASRIMDRCCGHPSPDYQYHYHKYPICVNTPFVDEGETHSPLIGFAFDGFPIYGPYESKGLMAKDLAENKLNGLNAHYDKERGWHYHVTPGKFPYIIGGFIGVEGG